MEADGSGTSTRVDQATLLRMALSDELTGLPNRRALGESVGRFIQEAIASGTPLAIGIADIDFFKSVNDRFGHEAGDECLRLVAAALRDSAREGDLVGRYGGEEFLAIFRDCDVAESVKRAEDLRHAVGEVRFVPAGAARVPVSASIGVAAVPVDSHEPFHTAVASADAALYRAKESGRDRVVAHDASLERRKEQSRVFARQWDLPALRGRIFGRDAAIEAVRSALADHGEITLTGTGGCGKTTLAVAAARDAGPRFEHGVAFVDLTQIRDESLVAVRIAEYFGIRAGDAAAAKNALRTYLRRQKLLLVLDNCEHLLDAVRDFVDALTPTGNLRIIATSRQPLGLLDEFAVQVAPLDGDSALATFISHAPASAVADTEQSRRYVAQICRRLDGIPLAIELAASHLTTMTLEELHRDLTGRIAHLEDSPGEDVREETLRALYDLSYERLDERERRLFRSLSAFAGGWTLSAAVDVCAVDADEAVDVLDLLVDRSLVVRTHSREAGHRFGLLESAREYARLRAVEAGEEGLLLERHAAHFAARAQRAAKNWLSTATDIWLPPMRRELENVRVALERYTASDAPAWRELRLGSLPLFYELGLPDEGSRQARAVLGGPVTQAVRACCNAWVARFENASWHHVEALAAADEAIGDARAVGDAAVLAEALSNAAGAHIALRDDLALAQRYLDEAQAIFRETGIPAGIAYIEGLRGVKDIVQSQDPYCALAHYESALEIYRAIGRKDGTARMLTNIGIAYGMMNRSARALAATAEAVEILERMHNTVLLGIAHNNLSAMLADNDALDAARAHARRAMELSLAVGNRLGAVRALICIAEVKIKRNEDEASAIRIRGFELAEYAREGLSPQPHQDAYLETIMRRARDRVGESEYARLLAEGAAMPLEQAVELAYA